MNAKDKGETTDQSIVIEDLSAENAEAIKGGPDRDKCETYLELTLTN